MLPIHAFVADVDGPAELSAADRFAEVGGLFITWVESGFVDDVPGFVLPDNDTTEPIPGHSVRVESERTDDAHERFRIVWRQPALFAGGEYIHEYAVARAGELLSASVIWHLTADGPIPPGHADPDRPAVLDPLRAFLSATDLDDRHPLDGIARRDRGGAFRAVDAVLNGIRTTAECEREEFYRGLEADCAALLAEREELRRELEDLNDTLFEQRAQIHSLSGRRRRGEVPTEETFEPRSVAEAVAKAKSEYPNELVFLRSADDSAADSPYQDPYRVYELLHALGDITRRWRTNTLNMDWLLAFKEFDPQFVCKPHLSQTTGTANWEDYAFQYDGVKRLFEPHVTLGSSHNPVKCLSVHWFRDEEAKKVVVGWCGRHRPNTKS